MMEPQTAADQQLTKRPRKPSALYLVLEGGGAKGIAHIAAWEALEPLILKPNSPRDDVRNDREQFELSGVAGTSAGAVVAAFIAAGATSKVLIDDSGRLPLCDALGLGHLRDIFGIRGWRRLRNLRIFLRPSDSLLAAECRYSDCEGESRV